MVIERWVRRYQRHRVPVLILGEPGSGKSTLARRLHGEGPFVHLNGAVHGDLLAAELFGTRAGAFTGAVDRAGRLSDADGGTLFLDEAGELDERAQAGLLTWLDTREYHRLGDATLRRSSARLILATWRDPGEWMRPDLLDRLGHHVLVMPSPSREDLVAAMVDLLRRQAPGLSLAPDARDDLVAQARGSYRRALTRLEVGWMDALDQGSSVVERHHLPTVAGLSGPELVQRARLDEALRLGGGDVRRAAEAAGVHRSTLHRWMQRLASVDRHEQPGSAAPHRPRDHHPRGQ